MPPVQTQVSPHPPLARASDRKTSKRNSSESKFKRRRRVALIVETSLASGREILQGIAQYLREQRGWSVFHEPRSLAESVPSWLKGWKGDGIIARISSPRVADAVIATGLPIVDVLGMVPEARLPLVHIDDVATAQLVARNLLELRLKHFGFCGIADANWSDRRGEAFAATVQHAGHRCQFFRMHHQVPERWSWDKEQEDLARWLDALPKPAGVMVCSDQRGEHVIEACRRAGIAVPDRVAVVGVDNDSLLCELCDPPLSSVDTALERVGYAAAELLDRMMAGKPTPELPILFPPRALIVRASSDSLSVGDPDVSAALQFIRDHATDPIDVDDVVEHVSLSRSTLQRRFRSLLSRSMHDEILRRRLTRAQELLIETDLPLARVAVLSGFGHSEYLSAVFKKRVGQTPGGYRTARVTGAAAGRGNT